MADIGWDVSGGVVLLYGLAIQVLHSQAWWSVLLGVRWVTVYIDRVPVDMNGLKTGVLEIINTVLVT